MLFPQENKAADPTFFCKKATELLQYINEAYMVQEIQ
jgi:hypothetical protein